MTNPEQQKPSSSASQPISIRTDVPQSSRNADMSSDVPDLSYDYDYSTPASASSSNMIPTPVFDWTMPLVDDSLHAKASCPPLLEDWLPSSLDLAISFRHSSSSSSPQSRLSSSPPSRYCAVDGLDELNWEKQTHNPELSPCFTTATAVSSYHTKPDSSQPSSSSIDHVYPASSANQDTHCNQFIHFSPSQTSTLSTSACHTISPAVLSSISASIVHTQPPLKLHQPRPSRRIPIISLAELASAGEGLVQPLRRRKHSKQSHTTVPYPRSPLEALSPLPLDCHGFSPILEKREIGHLAMSKMNSYQSSRPPVLFRQGNLPSKVITCSCGCMESYTIR